MTINAPEVVLVASVEFVIDIALGVVAPRLVIDWRVEVFHITTEPVLALTAVSVPADIELTP